MSSGREIFLRNHGAKNGDDFTSRSRTGSVSSTHSTFAPSQIRVPTAPRGSLDPNLPFLYSSKGSASSSQLRWTKPLELFPNSANTPVINEPEPDEPKSSDDEKFANQKGSREEPILNGATFPRSDKARQSQVGHRAVNIDDQTVSLVLPDSNDPKRISEAISAHVIQNTSLSPLPPGANYIPKKVKSAHRSKQSVYTRSIKPLIYRFIGKPISASSPILRWWIFAIDLVHIFLLVLVPVQLAWSEKFTHIGWVAFYLIMDAVMMFDCWILAKVDFMDEYGLLVEDSERIVKRYLFQNRGILEIIVSWPWELLQFSVTNVYLWASFLGPVQDVDPLTYYQRKLWAIILFVKTFLRAPYLRIYQIHIPSLALPISRLIKCMFILMLIGHVDACLFWFIDFTLAPGDDRWIEQNGLTLSTNVTVVSMSSSTTHIVLTEAVPMSTQYLVSYLAALRSLVLKLREAKRDAENIYVIFEFVAGILSYGTVFGNIHSILELMDSTAAVNQAEEYHNFEMEGIISFMREKKIRPELQQMVRDYKELQWQKSKGLDEDHFFVGIPKSVQQEIKNFLYLDLVRKVPIFQNTDVHFQYTLAFKIRPMHVLDGWTIFRKGDEGEEMYFIKSGKVEICSEDGSIIFVTLTDGAFFGEIALFESCHRTAMARAKGHCELCTLSKDDFNILLNLYPNIADGITETIRLRKIQEEEKKKLAEEEAKLKKEEEERLNPKKRSNLHLGLVSTHRSSVIGQARGSRRASILPTFFQGRKEDVEEERGRDVDSVIKGNSEHMLPRTASYKKHNRRISTAR